MGKGNNSEALELRQQAESVVKIKASKTALPLQKDKMMKLIHELEVHQIELQMQNDELRMETEQSVYYIAEHERVVEALGEKMKELIRFKNLTVGRELKMIELKKEVNELLKQAGLEEKYEIV